jgi:hypothetical protein
MAEDRTTPAEQRLEGLSDDELLREWQASEEGTPEVDLILGEIERRNLDL